MVFRTRQRLCQLTIALHVTVLAVAPAVAQDAGSVGFDLSVAAGPSPHDLIGTGTGFAAGAWLGYPLQPFLFAEAGVGYFRYETQGGTRAAYVLPEVGIRAGAPLGPLFPYIGAGAGFGSAITGGLGTDLTLHAALGIRGWLTSRVGLRGEGRLRTVDPWTGSMVDLTAGVLVRL